MLKGIIAALVTPLKESEELDLDALERIVERVVVGGVHGILVLGSQGEFYALSAREQHEVVLAAVQAASGRVPVYAGTSAITTREAVRLAKRAERCGVTGVSALPPFFVRPSRGELHAHYVSIASAIDVPVIAYNQPRFTGITLEAGLIADLALASAVVGIKASGDFGQALEYLAACPADFAVLLGNDGQIAYGLIAGAQGAVAASANVFPELCVQIYDAIAAGDTTKALTLQRRLAQFRNAFGLGTFPVVVKEALALVGEPVGPCRRPVAALTSLARAELADVLDALRTYSAG